MICKLEDTSKAAALFAGWPDTCIISCLQKVMGDIFVTDPDEPRSAMARLGEYAFYGGAPSRELAEAKSEGLLIMVPLTEEWAKLIEDVWPNAEKAFRFATKKEPRFDRSRLEAIAASLPEGYALHKVEGELLDIFLKEGYFSNFRSKAGFEALGRGFAVIKEGRIVSSATSYSRYREGIEVDVETSEQERRKGLALAVCAKLILSCLDEGLYPSWDAANIGSLHLAQKLGYEFDCEYASYEIE